MTTSLWTRDVQIVDFEAELMIWVTVAACEKDSAWWQMNVKITCFIYLFKSNIRAKRQYAYIQVIKAVNLDIELLKNKTWNIQIYNMKLLFKNYVKLTLKCRSNCSDVKEDLKLARELNQFHAGIVPSM